MHEAKVRNVELRLVLPATHMQQASTYCLAQFLRKHVILYANLSLISTKGSRLSITLRGSAQASTDVVERLSTCGICLLVGEKARVVNVERCRAVSEDITASSDSMVTSSEYPTILSPSISHVCIASEYRKVIQDITFE